MLVQGGQKWVDAQWVQGYRSWYAFRITDKLEFSSADILCRVDTGQMLASINRALNICWVCCGHIGSSFFGRQGEVCTRDGATSRLVLSTGTTIEEVGVGEVITVY